MTTSITISLTRFAEPNWLVRDAIDSLARQAKVRAEILFLDQQDDAEMRARCSELSTAELQFHYIVIPARNLSYARNRAIELSASEIILYIDSDAIADPLWAHSLSQTLGRSGVGVAGGRILPKWLKPPLFIARSRMVLGSYSMLDLGDGEQSGARLYGASFGIHRERLGPDAYFSEKLGRRPDGGLLGGEEIDLCIRVAAKGLGVIYNGSAVVQHQVLSERISYRWLMRRFYFSGIEKALTDATMAPSVRGRSLIDFFAYALTFPATVMGYWYGRRMRVSASSSESESAEARTGNSN